MQSAAGDPMRSAAGDPDLEHLFHPQLTDEDGNRTMVREAGGDSIEIRCAFAVTLACVFAEFSTAASAADIYEMYKEWSLVHAKKQRQKCGAGSAVEDTHGGGDVARGSVFVDAAQGEGAGGGDVAGAAAGEGIADGDAADAAQGQDTHGGGDVARAGNVDTNVSLYRDAMDLVEEINAMSGEEQQALLNGLQLSLQGETIEESVAELQRSRSLGGLD